MIKVYGSSDDLIEIDGDIREEFNPASDDATSYLSFSDGTVLSVEYSDDGIWRINRVAIGTSKYSKVEALDPGYTDTVELESQITWCVFGSCIKKSDKK